MYYGTDTLIYLQQAGQQPLQHRKQAKGVYNHRHRGRHRIVQGTQRLDRYAGQTNPNEIPIGGRDTHDSKRFTDRMDCRGIYDLYFLRLTFPNR